LLTQLLAKIEYDGELSATAWAILVFMLTLIIGGLMWCFYRAVSAANNNYEEQKEGEV